jgi:putative nucleotidyltransferase with HDIG domain
LVGTLAKEACEAIRANPLLARVGAYYHDIGKGRNPQYFAENMRAGHNPHDKLKPHMSALIIKAHVKDGLELARQHGLPQEIQDFIAMHHGTTLISYFYHRAKSQEDPDIPEVEEEDYRYPGPKPQTRETAIVMLADGIEAATRAMPDPTPARIKGLVQTMINKLFADGQFDECDLTLKDLNAIAKAFIRVLTSMYHTRPQYPDQGKHPGAKPAPKKPEPVHTTDEHKRKAEEAEVEATVEEARKPARLDSEPGLRRRKAQPTPLPHPNKGRGAGGSDEEPVGLATPEAMRSASGEFAAQEGRRPNMEKELMGLLAASRYQPPAPRPSFERMTGPLVAVGVAPEGAPASLESLWCEPFDLGPSSVAEGDDGAPSSQDAPAAHSAPTAVGPAEQGAPDERDTQEVDDGPRVDPERAFGGDGVGGEAEFGAPEQAPRQPLRRLGLS